MPIYEYRCPGCGYEFERLQRISDAPVKSCPECGQADVKKLVSQSGFVLKGAGWYKDHYGLKSGSSDSSTGGSNSGSTSSSTSNGSESAGGTSAAKSEGGD